MSSPGGKAGAWDSVGLDFWRRGRRSAKPTVQTTGWFLSGVTAGDPVLIVGGTSVGLIRGAVRAGADVTIADFSRRICRELARELAGRHDYPHRPVPRVVEADVASESCRVPGPYRFVLSDTLINRFDGAEAEAFVRTVARLLVPGGRLRATVKLGLYEMDRRLLRIAREASGEAGFWDEASQTIDFSKVPADLLDRGLVRHGGIARASLLAWYARRGREKRYREHDLRRLFDPGDWHRPAFQPDDQPERIRAEATRARAPVA